MDEVDTNKPPSEDDYNVIKLISNGAYGAVYLVRHKQTKQRFAMKKINKQNLIMRNQVEQVFAERDIMSITDNPFVVSMFCSFETKKYLCMVMEYVEGGDCATLLKNMGPFPVDLARLYFAETILAVEYLHNHGIVHRDLKPDNLLITSMGHIKLTDFGLSKMGLMNLATNIYEGYLDRETKQFTDKQICGTPEYLAPEVILRQGYGRTVDWWSMGIILYEFLIGCVPFFGETPEELFAHVVNDEIEWPDEEDWPLLDECKDIITQLLQRNPNDRLGACGAAEVKEHSFFNSINWESVLRQKSEFIPQLDGEEDTSYFDTRADRYNHEFFDSEELDDTDDSSLFGSFSSCSPRYHKVYSRVEKELEQEFKLRQSSSSSSASSLKDENQKVQYTRRFSTQSDNVIMRSFSVNTEDSNESRQSVDGNDRLSPNEIAKRIAQSTPESSQTESDDVSPQMPRRRKPLNIALPKFSFSVDVDDRTSITTPPISAKELPLQDETPEVTVRQSDTSNGHRPPSERIAIPSNQPTRARQVIKSASASGLSLIISDESNKAANVPSTSSGGSNTSSRNTSPNRDMNSLAAQLKPPIIITKGPRGFGFTLRAIRVYHGDSDVYTMHHLVLSVETNSPAFEAGLAPGDLITHINGEAVQGLLHHEVLQLILSGGDKVHIRTTPLENTTIKSGGRKRNPVVSKMARRRLKKHHKTPKSGAVKRSDSDRRRRSSMLRRLSSKRASTELQQYVSTPTGPSNNNCRRLSSGGISPPILQELTASRSYHSLQRTMANLSLDSAKVAQISAANIPNQRKHPRSPPAHRLTFSQSDSSPGTSSLSSSPTSSVPNSPANSIHSPHFPRPSTLHGLKHKLVKTFHSPRRKSCGHIPLSPLARTPSPQVLPIPSTSPTRSPSPLAYPITGHHPGSSQTTQTFLIHKTLPCNTPISTPTSSSTTATTTVLLTPTNSVAISRPKSAEPSSPQFRRSASPDRHNKSETTSLFLALRPKRESFSGFISSPLALASYSPPVQAETPVEPINVNIVDKSEAPEAVEEANQKAASSSNDNSKAPSDVEKPNVVNDNSATTSSNSSILMPSTIESSRKPQSEKESKSMSSIVNSQSSKPGKASQSKEKNTSKQTGNSEKKNKLSRLTGKSGKNGSGNK